MDMYGHREACGFDIGLCQCANLHHCSLCDGKSITQNKYEGNQTRIGNTPIVFRGFPMTTPAILLAAMVIRYGGRVELTETELKAAQGLMITPGTKGIVLEANTKLYHGALEDSLITEIP